MFIKKLYNYKLVFIGDTNSINLEIIEKAHNELISKKIKYILLGNLEEANSYFKKIKSKKKFFEILDFKQVIKMNKHKINFFDIGTAKGEKSLNIINQINISNNLCKFTKKDLVTMPINKSIIKKNYLFNGMTEYLGMINNSDTYMLMRGDQFSIIPLTTHVKFTDIFKNIKISKINNYLYQIIENLKIKKVNYNKIIILGINPHAGENGTLGDEELIINQIIKQIIKKEKITIIGPVAADSAFRNIDKKSLYISFYHDQALIPFKIINKIAVNFTIGLQYNRYSPAHGTAEDIIFKNKADITSYKRCMLY